MASRVPTYIPTPNWDIPADSDILVLGRFIKDPKNPESRVPRSGVKSIPESDIQAGKKTDWKATLEHLRSGKIGIWMKCLQMISGEASFSTLISEIEEHKFDTLETKYFVPDDDYISGALADPNVQGYLKANNWRKPLYVITGVKIARGASVTVESNKEKGLEVELKADGSPAAGAATVGPGGSWTGKGKKGVSYTGATDYVFAYRLLRLMFKRDGQGISSKPVVKGALFGNEGSDATEASLRETFDLDYFDDAHLCIADTLDDLDTLETGEGGHS